MKVYMDRTKCTCWQAACESSFGWRLTHLREGQAYLGGCMFAFEEDGRQSTTFLIHDNDGDKVLKVNDQNWPEAYDSWLLLWQRQQEAVESLN